MAGTRASIDPSTAELEQSHGNGALQSFLCVAERVISINHDG